MKKNYLFILHVHCFIPYSQNGKSGTKTKKTYSLLAFYNTVPSAHLGVMHADYPLRWRMPRKSISLSK